jgi:hypothetical protein
MPVSVVSMVTMMCPSCSTVGNHSK